MSPFLWDRPFILAIVAASQSQSQRNTVHLELVGQVAQDESLVVSHEHILGVDEEDEVRRTHSRLDQIVYLQGVVMVLRKILYFFEFVEPIVEQAC